MCVRNVHYERATVLPFRARVDVQTQVVSPETRRAEIRRKLEMYQRHKERLDGLMDALRLEDQLLEKPFRE
jgi:hypothetical protein